MFLIYLFLPFLSKCQENEGKDNPIAVVGLSTNWYGLSEDSNVYISTANGYFHYINIFTGEIIWSIDTGGPIFNSTETDKATFIPSIDGFLFTFINNYGYRRIPLPIRDLVFFSPFKSETGEIFTSGKSSSFFIVNDKGKIVYSYMINSTFPSQGNIPSGNDGTIIFRIDYTLNIFEGKSQVVKFSEFDVHSKDVLNGHHNNENIFINNKIKITTTFNGDVIIYVNGSITSHLKLNGVPTSIFGKNGKFEFEMNSDGHPMSRSSVAFMNINGNNVAAPSRPLKTPKHFDVLAYSLPALPGSKGPHNEEQFNYGVFDIKGPFSAFGPLQSNIDPKRPANLMTDGLSFRLFDLRAKPIINYRFVSISLFLIFLILLFLKYYLMKYLTDMSSSIQIIISKENPNIGSFNNTQCSIFYTKSNDSFVTQPVIEEICQMSHPYTLKIKAFFQYKDQIIIASQQSIPYDFSQMNPNLFIKRMMKALSSMFKRGLVHGSISSSSIFTDNEGAPILGEFQVSTHFSTEASSRSEDVRKVGMIVLDHVDPAYLSSDPLLYDLLTEMCGSSFSIEEYIKKSKSNEPSQNEIFNISELEEIPTPEEVLNHPFFFSSVQKLDLIVHASNFLLTKESRNNKYIDIFNEHSAEIVGGNWMHFLDSHLLQEAIYHTDYKGEFTAELIRFIRNKWLHSPILPSRKKSGSSLRDADEYFKYFQERFPNLFLYTYYFIDRYDKVMPKSF